MHCDALREDQWERIKGFVPGGTKGKCGPRTNGPAIPGCAAMGGPFGRSLARSTRTAWRLPLLLLDRVGVLDDTAALARS